MAEILGGQNATGKVRLGYLELKMPQISYL